METGCDVFMQKYQIIKELGKGTYGKVMLVKNLESDRLAALKQIIIPRTKDNKLNPQKLKMAQREILFLKKIADPQCNPYLACYYDSCIDYNKNIVYIEMEYIDGPDIKTYLSSLAERNLPLDEITGIIYKIIRSMILALKDIHNKGILHLDVKPENILINKNGISKLVDFGVSCITLPKTSNICVIHNKTIGECCPEKGGTIAFTAPELYLYGVRYPTSDYWSLGSTIYYLLNNQYIWNRLNYLPGNIDLRTIMKDIVENDEPEELNLTLEPINTIVNGMTQKNISDRLNPNQILDIMDKYNV